MLEAVPPLISIAIPVWNGSDYVADAVHSVLAQPLDDLELVVSISATDEGSQQVLRAFDDPRLRVLHSPGTLGMASHYEWCLEHLHGDWVTILGQDDGLMFDFTQKVTRLIHRFPDVSAFSFRRAYFFWPGCESTYGDRGLMLRAGPNEHPVDSDQAMLRAMKGLLEHHDFPQVYTNGLVRLQTVREIKERSGGYFYHDMTPDVYSGFVIAKHLGTYVHVDYPAFWTGTSPASTGLAIASDGSETDNPSTASIRAQHLESAKRTGLGTSSVVGQELWLKSGSSAIFVVSALDSCPFTEPGLPSTKNYEVAFAALTAQLLLSLLPAFPRKAKRLQTWLLMKRRADRAGLRFYRIMTRVPLLVLSQCTSRLINLWHDRGPSTTISVSIQQGSIKSIREANDRSWRHFVEITERHDSQAES